MASVADLSKQLMELEQHAKVLRSEVDHLQATQRTIAISAATESKMLEIRQTSPPGSAAPPSRTGRGTKGKQQAGGLLPLPQDMIDDLAHKAGDVSVAMNAHRALQREMEALQLACEHARTKTLEAEQEYVSLVELAGADEDGKSTLAVGLKKRNDYMAALKQTVAAYRERELLRVQLQNQTAELQRISSLLEQTTNAEEQRTEAKAMLLEKQEALRQLRAKRYALTRSVNTKDKILEKPDSGPSEEEVIRSANYDRRVAQYELEKQAEHIKANELAIRHRAMQIAKMERRIELIGDAVGGNGLSEEQRVDVELIDGLMAEAESLYNLRAETDAQMGFLDADIEVMEYRVAAMHHTTASTQKELEKIDKDHSRYMALIKKEVEQEQMMNERDIVILEQEIERLGGHRYFLRESRSDVTSEGGIQFYQESLKSSQAHM